MKTTASESPSNEGKFRHIAFCCLPQLLFVLIAVGAFHGGYWLLLPILFLLLFVPIADLVTGWQDNGHFHRKDFSPAETFLLHWNTRLYAIFYIATVIYFAASLHRFEATEIGFLIGAVSLVGGIGFAVAHELLHGGQKLDQVLQRITTAFLFYPHYKLIHTQSHHLHAGTAEDQNTAWMNESIYAYLLRTIPGSMLRCWKLEAARLNKRNLSGWPRLLQNQMIRFALGQLAILLAFFLLAGWAGLLFYVAHLAGAHLVLESVNYIQHYGLLRKREDGDYEKTAARHSWDTYHFFSSYATFRVGHHSYHHLAANPYYLLPPEEEAPKLPVGYFWAIVMVLIPFWWRKVINPKLEATPDVPLPIVDGETREA